MDGAVSPQSAPRRSSYGPNSPTVGARGERTRQHIVSESLRLFGEKGYQATKVSEIADAVDISRTALYQYFESKEDIFVGLLDECGRELLSTARKVGPLGPTLSGFANLVDWLSHWTSVYEKYGTLFVAWPAVAAQTSAVRGLVIRFLDTYNQEIASRLEASGLAGLDPHHAAIVTTTVVHRFNYVRSQRPPATAEIDAAEVGDIALVVQAILYPETPPEVLPLPRVGARPVTSVPIPAIPPIPPIPAIPPIPPIPAIPPIPPIVAVRPVRSGRSATTVERIMRAGATTFATQGYDAANVDEIVAVAGLARGTFYRYFGQKLDLLVALSEDARTEVDQLANRFAHLPTGPARGAELRSWLTAFIRFRRGSIGIVRTWSERSPQHDSLDEMRRSVEATITRTITVLIDGSPYRLLLPAGAVEIMFTGVLDRLPDVYPAIAEDPAELVELIASVIERVVLRTAAPVPVRAAV
ncbi:MAG: transcriptional regulator, TetR family [Pseudonocardiales bacterium]|nr:transcriptional regulator, TetR family [Pseudonocardiales bacterium]